ncbi:hypothetical protein N7603_03075 [Acholeplasma vituli]|uniref:ATPase dynein-related AAA domain-containing protein n=1 Tax=Paracholeplasma vituli TaxID=69473 RepID=A0ABT2PY97_9MOLU|nr:hypothetical protein [Paracholeplasma vituli]MCU0104633.1 hypothetical protein [Paracholeplasma vituli]
MERYAQWFIDFVLEWTRRLGSFFTEIFRLFKYTFWDVLVKLYQDFRTATMQFTPIDWGLAIFSLIVMTLLYVGVFILFYQLIRKYVRFTKIDKSKEELLFEMSVLEQNISAILDEKNAIVALSNEATTKETSQPMNGSSKRVLDVSNRFPRLTKIDQSYQYKPLQVKSNLELENVLSLSALVERFINFSASNLKLYYTKKTISIFFAGMASSKTMILEGISGTGKTSLPYAMGKFFKQESKIISVQPSWRDRSEMMGYFNEFTKKFNETDFLAAVYEATYRNDLNFIVLDEMNLARVEYYFADFLSLLEMPNPNEWRINIVPVQYPDDPKNLIEGKLIIPQNVWFIGTANKDDSTYTITDKVYDRVASIEMNHKAVVVNAPLTEGVHCTFEDFHKLIQEAFIQKPISNDTVSKLKQLDDYIVSKFNIAFGNRIIKQIHAFIPVYVACGMNEIDGLDYIVSRKIIRKFESLNLPFLKNELVELIDYIYTLFGKETFPESVAMIQTYMRQY